jgi:hypothetical protein
VTERRGRIEPVPTLRFLAVDARHARLGRPRSDFGALAERIAVTEPDLVCVHGSPAGPRWRTVSGAFARQAGLVVVGGGRHAGSNLLLSSLAVDVVATRDAALDGGSPRPVDLRRRHGAALAVLRRGRAHSAFAVAAARLDADPAAGSAQAAALQLALTELATDDVPTVLSIACRPSDGHLPAPVADALTQSRAVLPGGVFVDHRIAAESVRQLDIAPDAAAAVLAELTLPG